MGKMIEVVIDSVRVSLTNQQRIVILKDVVQERYLPIWIGPYEAEAITIALQEVEIARPQTHDLIKNIIQTLNARLLRVEITSLKDDVYYANLILEINAEEVRIDSRPSDAVAIAVRYHAPILVSNEVMDLASITPELEEPEGKPGASTPKGKDREVSSDRLSIFEDFIDQIDAGKSPPDKPQEDDQSKPKKPKKS